jgi:CRISPR-associated endonuclease Csn1
MEVHGGYVLGLDLGVASIGWCLIRLRLVAGTPEPVKILRSGVHLFQSGTEGDIERGKDESRAGPRRNARSLRRAYIRRRQRRRNVMKLLQGCGLLPAGDVTTPQGVDTLIKALDERLRTKWEAAGSTTHRERQLMVYRLRAKAASTAEADRLDAEELGRAILHLAMRRGFRSNRKDLAEQRAAELKESGGDGAADGAAAAEKPAKAGKAKKSRKADAAADGATTISKGSPEPRETGDLGVLDSIEDLKTRMEAGGFATLGAYYASLDPVGAADQRIRKRWTSRDMYLAEFKAIWSAQARHHPTLTEAHAKALERAIFSQRPLKSAKGLIGQCELETKRRRAPLASRPAQRFRVLAAVNNLRIRETGKLERELNDDERAKVLDTLLRDGDKSFTALAELLGFKRRGDAKVTFNLEEGGEKRMVGHRTDAKLRKVFGERWDTLSEAERDAVVVDLLQFEKPAALARAGRKRWGLAREAAEAFGELLLEPGYAALSLAALRKILPEMEKGKPFATVRTAAYDAHKPVGEALATLPPVDRALGMLRNPAVERTLTEVRKLVNAIIRRFGKPTFIRVELARDLKRPRVARERMAKENRVREKRREDAVARIIKETGVRQPRRSDIERVLLADECCWICPYTGRPFGMHDLLSRNPTIDVEHIWPFALSLDDSFVNKTLCDADENRNRKQRRTPFQAYHGTHKWEEILTRVRRFSSDAGRIKLERFMAEQLPEGFAERDLQETRMVSVKASEYLRVLYGGANGVDNDGVRRVFTVTGGLAAHLRREWMLDAILSSGRPETPEQHVLATKNRNDHRHHAVDAAVIALTDQGTVQRLQRAAADASQRGRRLFAPVELPWQGFGQDLEASIRRINVSHRQCRRISGALHDQSIYSKPFAATAAAKGKKPGAAVEHRIRKPVAALSIGEVERIVDPAVRRAVQDALAKAGTSKPADAFKQEGNLPAIVDRNGVAQTIRAVRISVGVGYRKIGAPGKQASRFVQTASNHSTVITGRKIPGGQTADWEDAPLALIDAYAGRAKAAAALAAHRQSHNTPERLGEAAKHWPRVDAQSLGVKGEPNGVPLSVAEGRVVVMSLAANEFVRMNDSDGHMRLYRVLSVSQGDIELVEHADGRDSRLRKDAKERTRAGASGLRKRQAEKVTVTYLGEIKSSGS